MDAARITMTKRVTFWLGILTALSLAGPTARADSYRSKLGFDFKGLKTLRAPEIGWIAGVKWGWFLGKSDAYIGFGANFGTPTGGNPASESLYNLGVYLGYDGKYSRVGVWELSTFVGYGQGKLAGLQETSYYVVEPSFGSGFALGLGWRLLFTTSYLHMSRTTQLSGFSFGIRLDRRYDTTIKPLDP